MPWDERQQKNVYLAGHRVRCSGAESRLMFRELTKLSAVDSMVLKNRSNQACKCRLGEMFVTKPDAEGLPNPVRNHDTVTPQTCTYPTFEGRFIVGADRI